MYDNSNKRRGFVANASSHAYGIINPLLKKYGIADSKLVSDWEHIVGYELSKKTIPVKIASSIHKGINQKTLYIMAFDSGTALFLDYQKDLILEKISFYLGKSHIHKIKIQQGKQHIQEEEEFIISQSDKKVELEETGDEQIDQALAALGNLVVNNRQI